MALLLLALVPATKAEDFSAKEVVLEHIKDSHEWHVWGEGENSIVIPLPVIVNSSTGWHVFCSSQFEHHADANGLRQGPYGLAIATEGDQAGKIVENGSRPLHYEDGCRDVHQCGIAALLHPVQRPLVQEAPGF